MTSRIEFYITRTQMDALRTAAAKDGKTATEKARDLAVAYANAPETMDVHVTMSQRSLPTIRGTITLDEHEARPIVDLAKRYDVTTANMIRTILRAVAHPEGRIGVKGDDGIVRVYPDYHKDTGTTGQPWLDKANKDDLRDAGPGGVIRTDP